MAARSDGYVCMLVSELWSVLGRRKENCLSEGGVRRNLVFGCLGGLALLIDMSRDREGSNVCIVGCVSL